MKKEEINELYKESVEKGYSKRMQEFFIKLGANTRSVYELITMSPHQVHELFLKEIKKRNPDLELIRDILDYSVLDVNTKDSDGYTALFIAVSRRNYKVIELLLNHLKIDVNVKSKGGETALILGVKNGYDRCIELLLNHPGINVNVKSKGGETALMRAIKNGYEFAIKVLLNHPHIDVNVQGKGGNTALMETVSIDWGVLYIELLLNHPKIDVNLQDKWSRTAWDLAPTSIRQQFPKLNPNA
jgi:ankyrin repeat protein